jgi:hypothetical protein
VGEKYFINYFSIINLLLSLLRQPIDEYAFAFQAIKAKKIVKEATESIKLMLY